MLYDRDFLLKLDRQKNKITYAKITSLTMDESPIESIEGKITQGSINIDGKSAVRRTCSLSILLNNYNYNDYSWSLETKFKLEIGVQNSINAAYPEIIWFNQGIFLLTGFNTSRGINSFTLSISGKDKMCLLNGDLGGNIEATTDFGQIDEEIEGEYVTTKLDIQTILKNLLLVYAKEKSYNVIIKDLPEYGVELLEYRYDTPMYMYRLRDEVEYQNGIMEDEDTVIYRAEDSINLFDFDSWRTSSSNQIHGGTMTVNQEQKSITITSTSDDCYTYYGGSSSQYHINVTPGNVYRFSYSYRTTQSQQAFVFFYTSSGAEVTAIDLNGQSLENPWINDYNGNPITFKVPSGASKIGLRVGVTSNNTTATFSNLKVECVKIAEGSIDADDLEEMHLINISDNDLEWLTPTINDDNEIVNNPANFYIKSGNNYVGPYVFAKIQYGHTAGYRKTALTYPGDLIANPGDTIVSVLDKIKNMLGEFEYFYDLDGRFVFQKKKSSLKSLSSSVTEIGIQMIDQQEAISYIFNDSELIISLGSNPNLSNIKNDYSVWGEKQTASGAKIPIHIRYAIDKKPKEYVALNDIVFTKLNPKTEHYLQSITLNSGSDTILYTFNYQTNGSGEEASPVLFNAAKDTTYTIQTSQPKVKNYFCIKQGSSNVYIHRDCFNQNGNSLTVKDLSAIVNSRKKYIYSLSSSGVNFSTTNAYSLGQDNSIEGYYNIKRYVYTPTGGTETTLKNVWIKKASCSKVEILCDWREVIYQMAYDYYTHNGSETFEQDISAANPELCKNGKTGYEKYYADIYSFWRDIYNPEIADTQGDYYDLAEELLKEIEICQEQIQDSTDPDATTSYYTTVALINRLAALKKECLKIIGWPSGTEEIISEKLKELQDKLYSLCTEEEIETNNSSINDGKLKELDNQLNDFYLLVENVDADSFRAYQGWLKSVFMDPENIIFWFDFLDTTGELAMFNVSNIGQRTKVLKDTKITNVFQRETLNVLFGEEETSSISGYSYIKINNEDEMFSVSSRGKSCQDSLTELLNQQLSFSESVNLTTIPIYYLEPNTRIQINNVENKIFGNYNIDKITINLAHNGNTQISCSTIKQDLFI